MKTSSMELENIKVLIEEQLQHTYLEKYIQKPVIDEEKLLILSSIINNTTIPESKRMHYIITTMLVQIALDTHDTVPRLTEPDESESDKRKRQLTVLAGDFYSGLYYLLLAEMEDYDMIDCLASAIKEINEYKMMLYYKEVESTQTFIDLVKNIESLLIVRVSEFVQEYSLINTTKNWLLINRLMREWQSFHNNDTPIFNVLLRESSTDSSSTLADVETIIQSKRRQLQETVPTLPFKYNLLTRHIMNKLSTWPSKQMNNVEEG